MGKDETVFAQRVERARNPRTGGRDKPIDDHRYAPRRASQTHTRDAGDLVSAQAGKDTKGSAGSGWLQARTRRPTSTFLCLVVSSMPVPVNSSDAMPVMLQISRLMYNRLA